MPTPCCVAGPAAPGLEPPRAGCGVWGLSGTGSGRFGDVFSSWLPFPPPHCFDFPQSFSWAWWGRRGHLLCPAETGETMERGVTRQTREGTVKRGHGFICANRRKGRAAFRGWEGAGRL